MAITLGSGTYFANSKTGTTHSVSITSGIPAGKLVLVAVGCDNLSGVSAATQGNVLSIADSGGNSYTLASAYQFSLGASKDGASSSIWYKVLTNAISAGGTVTVTCQQSAYARAAFVQVFNIGTSSVYVAGTNGAGAAGAATPVVTIASVPGSTEYLWAGAAAQEAIFLSSAGPGFTQIGGDGTQGFPPAGNQTIALNYVIDTGQTTKTFSPAPGAAADSAAVLVAFMETTGTAVVAVETGSDIAAGSGTLGELPNVSRIAAIETNSDTAGFSGVAAVAGSFNTTEAGSDGIAATATVAGVGELTAVETEADAAVFSGELGELLVNGSLDATETDPDTALITGASGAVGGAVKDNRGTSSTRFEERRHKARKSALVGKPLTEKQIRQLQDKVHEKRQAIWKRPEPEAEKKPIAVELPPPSQAPAELEKARTAVSIAKVQLEYDSLRKQREAELAVQQAEIDRQQEAQRLKRVAAEQEQTAKEAEQERIRLETLRKQEAERQEKADRLKEMFAEQERKLKEAEQERARVEKQNAEIARIKKTSETIAHFQRLLAEQEQRIREVEEERIRVEALHRQNQEVMAVLLS